MNRRQFLHTSGFLLSAVAGYAEEFAEIKSRVGLIGCGWYGKCDLLRLIQVAPVEVISLCDVDQRMLKEATEIVSTRQKSKKVPRAYSDYRKMLAERDLDVVLIATPDHWHALQTIASVQSGADVYVQKPISIDIFEGRAMVAAARKHKRVVQVGTQRRSTPHLVEARERIVQEGRLGKVALAEVYCYYPMRTTQNVPDSTPPNYLDYEMWTGPAPMRPYNSLVHPRGWRAFMEYGNGIVGDMCIHMLDLVRWMLGLNWPNQVTSIGGILVDKQSKANITDTQIATFDFGDLKVVWQHRTWGESNDPDYKWGATLFGDKGTLKLSVYGYDYKPVGSGTTIHRTVAYEFDRYPEDKVEKDLETHVAAAIRYHMQDFLRAIASRTPPVADIEEGHISTASCILANNSLRLRRSLAWDFKKQQVIGDDEANGILTRSYRLPWIHPNIEA